MELPPPKLKRVVLVRGVLFLSEGLLVNQKRRQIAEPNSDVACEQLALALLKFGAAIEWQVGVFQLKLHLDEFAEGVAAFGEPVGVDQVRR